MQPSGRGLQPVIDQCVGCVLLSKVYAPAALPSCWQVWPGIMLTHWGRMDAVHTSGSQYHAGGNSTLAVHMQPSSQAAICAYSQVL